MSEGYLTEYLVLFCLLRDPHALGTVCQSGLETLRDICNIGYGFIYGILTNHSVLLFYFSFRCG